MAGGLFAAQFVTGRVAHHQAGPCSPAPVGAIAAPQHHFRLAVSFAGTGPQAHQLQLQALLALPLIQPEPVGRIHPGRQVGWALPAPAHGA